MLPGALYRACGDRIKKIEQERRCVLCSAPPTYMVCLIEIDQFKSGPQYAGKRLWVCHAHHPNEKIDPEGKLNAHIHSIDTNLTWGPVYPCKFH